MEGESTRRAIRRELKEETGLRAVSMTYLGSFPLSQRDGEWWSSVYAVWAFAGRMQIGADEPFVDLAWWPECRLPKLSHAAERALTIFLA